MMGWEEKHRKEVLEELEEQIKIEGELVSLYRNYEKKTENKALKRMMQVYRLDSQKHINLIQSTIEIINGEDLFIEDKEELKKSLEDHIELESEAIKRANRILRKGFIAENQGLKELIEIWRDDEKRHHRALKELANKTYFRLSSNDMVALFRDEKFLEDRYKSAKEYKEKLQH
ncbi:hypothetical protein GF319_13130 [Candidatus Bathyarchaeota archaeon]|nr:hypothetical protein [Candidatus Bathyarchaeota archaeon]